MKYPKDSKALVGSRIEAISSEIAIERLNQLARWGVQNHPSVSKLFKEDHDFLCSYYQIPTEEKAKRYCDLRLKQGKGTWTDIALEELCEAVSSPTPKLMREELVQLAAVVESWIDSIDRNEL